MHMQIDMLNWKLPEFCDRLYALFGWKVANKPVDFDVLERL